MKKLQYCLNGTGVHALRNIGGTILVLGLIGGLISIIVGIGTLGDYRADEALGASQITSGIIGIFLCILIKIAANSISSINENIYKLRVMQEHELNTYGFALEEVEDHVENEVPESPIVAEEEAKKE